MKLGHWERLVLVLSACRLAPDPVHQSPRCHRKALFESMPSFLRVLIMTKEVKGFAYSRNGWCLKVKLRTQIPAFSSRGQAALQPLIQTLDYSWLLKAGVGTVVDPLIWGYFSIVNMLLLILGPWLIEPGSVEQPQIRKADYKLHVDPRIYYINACWVISLYYSWEALAEGCFLHSEFPWENWSKARRIGNASSPKGGPGLSTGNIFGGSRIHKLQLHTLELPG